MSELSPTEQGDLESSPSQETSASAGQLAWRALTAPRTGGVLAVCLALVWAMVLIVPQGTADSDLLSLFSYAEVQAIRSLGLQNIVTSWPSLALILLLLLHIVGLVLRAREQRVLGLSSAPDGWSAMETLELQGSVESHESALSGGTHGTFYARQGEPGLQGGTRLWRGLWREGLILISVSAGVALISVPVDLVWGLDARMTLATPPGEAVAKPVSTEVRDFRGWVQGESPVQVVCQDPDPADALRRRACEARSAEGVFPVTLRAGTTAQVAGVQVSPAAERPRRQTRRTSLLLKAPGEGPRVLRAESGRTYELASGGRLTTFQGPDGPLVVGRANADERPFLLGPGGQGDSMHLGHRISGVPGWIFELDMKAKPGHSLRLAAALLVLVGLLLMALVPHVEVILRPSGSGVEAVIRSHNRPGLPRQLGATLAKQREGS